jgi:hypothetical protein
VATGDFSTTNGEALVKVEGLTKTVRAMSRAGADAGDMKNLMHSIGMMIVRQARVPVLTGRLEASLRAGKGKTKAVARAGGARVPYAGVVHYGWPARNIEPNPFLDTARNQNRSSAFGMLSEGIDEILRRNDLK